MFVFQLKQLSGEKSVPLDAFLKSKKIPGLESTSTYATNIAGTDYRQYVVSIKIKEGTNRSTDKILGDVDTYIRMYIQSYYAKTGDAVEIKPWETYKQGKISIYPSPTEEKNKYVQNYIFYAGEPKKNKAGGEPGGFAGGKSGGFMQEQQGTQAFDLTRLRERLDLLGRPPALFYEITKEDKIMGNLGLPDGHPDKVVYGYNAKTGTIKIDVGKLREKYESMPDKVLSTSTGADYWSWDMVWAHLLSPAQKD